ncbi:MAG: polysaccharide export protein, partial [Muribaculaceae bacterium]|nr:polysaccharide export protein [Muribaculaceae bacterium]
MKLRHITLALVFGAAVTSCSTSKTVLPYFTDISTVTSGVFKTGDYTPEIKPDDELLITVSSINPEATAIYNLPLSNPAKQTEMFKVSTPSQQTYKV